jgi:alkylated DNA repair protein (DNA oxidative demethylase)
MMAKAIGIRPGALHYRALLAPDEQSELLAEVKRAIARAPFYRPRMPRTGKPMSVEMSNFGPLGWVTDRDKGYRYEPLHPETGRPWPDIPPMLLKLWEMLADYPVQPEACLVNLYRGRARMGLHQDLDEGARDAPVLSVSLGDDALFRIGGAEKGAPTASFVLGSGDVFVMGGPARLCRHGVDHIRNGSSRLIAGGGRISLTLRRVAKIAAKPGGLK